MEDWGFCYVIMEKTYKRLPFDIELAKKIQSGEVEGRIVTSSKKEVTIIKTDALGDFPIVGLIQEYSSLEIAHSFSIKGVESKNDYVLSIELPEETSKHEFKVGDKVKKRTDYEGDIYEIIGFEKIGSRTYVVAQLGDFIHMRYLFGEEEVIRYETNSNSLEFKPFDKVLVRDGEHAGYCCWYPAFFSRYSEDSKGNVQYVTTDGFGRKQCIPYEGNSHLVGTTNNPE